MGYDVHITRKPYWADDDGERIEIDDWLAYLATDAEMRHDGFAEANVSGGTFRIVEPGLAVWTRHPESPATAWVSYSKSPGCITVKNPDEPFLAKMHAIATRLGARVQGDEGEVYGPNGEILE